MARVSSWCLHSQESLLWVHGGHPFLPSSADLYQKQHQLLNLCELLWPRNTNLWRQGASSMVCIMGGSSVYVVISDLFSSIFLIDFSPIAVNDGLIEAAVSANPELRFLAMRGVDMSLYVMANNNLQ